MRQVLSIRERFHRPTQLFCLLVFAFCSCIVFASYVCFFLSLSLSLCTHKSSGTCIICSQLLHQLDSAESCQQLWTELHSVLCSSPLNPTDGITRLLACIPLPHCCTSDGGQGFNVRLRSRSSIQVWIHKLAVVLTPSPAIPNAVEGIWRGIQIDYLTQQYLCLGYSLLPGKQLWKKTGRMLQWHTQYYQWTNNDWKEGECCLHSMEAEIMENKWVTAQ